MVIRRSVYGPRSELLLNAGTVLNPRFIGLLRDRSVIAAYVDSSDDAELTAEMVSERVRTTIVLGLCQVYDLETRDFMQAAQAARILQDEIERVITSALADAATIACLKVVRAFDSYQFVHALDSTVVAVTLGRRLRLAPERLVRIASGCLLHDYGMSAIDPAIWNRPGPLTSEERVIMNQHAQLGYDLLKEQRPERLVENNVALQHHEWQDGSGYPRGLLGKNVAARGPSARGHAGRILPDAEIVAVADVYEALSSDRPWRQALLPDVVSRTMRQLAGKHLNRELVSELLTLVTPFPLGATVIVARGQHLYYRGIVTQVHREAMDRPTIRLVQNDRLEPIDAMEVDLRATAEVIACIPAPGHDAAVEMTPEAEATLRQASQAQKNHNSVNSESEPIP